MTGYGYGSIYQRSYDGRWVGAVEVPRQQGEKRQRKVFTGKTREAVELKIDEYRLANPAVDYVGRHANIKRARALGSHTFAEWDAYFQRSKGICEYCREWFPFKDLTKDHRTPVSRGGSNALDNLAVACLPCNKEKGTMTLAEYEQWKAERVA